MGLKPMWVYTAGGEWRRVYDADEVEREREAAADAEAEAPLPYRDWSLKA